MRDVMGKSLYERVILMRRRSFTKVLQRVRWSWLLATLLTMLPITIVSNGTSADASVPNIVVEEKFVVAESSDWRKESWHSPTVDEEITTTLVMGPMTDAQWIRVVEMSAYPELPEEVVEMSECSELLEQVVESAPEQPAEANPELSKVEVEAPDLEAPDLIVEPLEGTSISNVDAETLSERELLARIIYLEARGESFEGMKAVGEVVMNRVKSRLYPNSIEAVLYERDQFSTASMLATTQSSDACYLAADEVLAGIDPVLPGPQDGKLVVFFSRSGQNDHVATIIGRHVFCYAYHTE